MIFGARPWLRKLAAIYHRRGEVTQDLLVGILLLALASARITEKLGIHALFGAFLLGAVMPKEKAFVEASRKPNIDGGCCPLFAYRHGQASARSTVRKCGAISIMLLVRSSANCGR
jgi:hypothetical protein